MKKKVVILGFDGLRPDAALAADTPNIDALAARGAYSWYAQTEFHPVSGPAWTSLLTGVHTAKHHVTDNEFEPRDPAFKTIFALARAWDPTIRTVGESHWAPIVDDIFEPGVLDQKGTGSDRAVARRLAKAITDDVGDLYFLQLDDIDDAGHRYTYGPDSPKYLECVEGRDAMIGPILAAVAARPPEEDWLVVAVSDHGGSGKGHGKPILDDLTIVFIVAGPAVQKKGEIPGREDEAPQIVDVVPTIARFLGMPPGPGWDGTPRGV